MNSIRHIITAYNSLLKNQTKLLMATVVEVSGSTYHRPGARMLIDEQLQHAGSISGGCLEKDLIQKAWWNLHNGPTLLTYDTRIEDEDSPELPTGSFNTGCSGLVHILLEELQPDETTNPVLTMQSILQQQTPAVIATIYRATGFSNIRIGQRCILQTDNEFITNISNQTLLISLQQHMRDALKDNQSACHYYKQSDASADILIEVLKPPRPLYIFGAGDDIKPLVKLAIQLGWRIQIIDQRTHLANASRFPDAEFAPLPDLQALQAYQPTADSAAVIMTHNIARDAVLIPKLLEYNFLYIGLLGPAARLQRLKNYWQYQQTNLSDAQMQKLHAPIGLDLGADNAAEIAIAVIAEIIAISNHRNGGTLNQHTLPLHKPPKYYEHKLTTPDND